MKKEIKFHWLKIGDIFYYGLVQKPYMKCDAGNYNAVNLVNGKAIYVGDCVLVNLLDGEFRINQVLDWSDENGD